MAQPQPSGIARRRPIARAIVFFLLVLVTCWMAMQIVHEAGHVLAVWMTGGQVQRVVVHPLTISRTDISHNPQPVLVAWAGPVFGVAAPLAMWLVASAVGWSAAVVLRFFAGFCLVANGAYMFGGAIQRMGDAADIVRHGAAAWPIMVFGLSALAAGLFLWHGTAGYFGLGDQPRAVRKKELFAAAMALVGVVVAGLLVTWASENFKFIGLGSPDFGVPPP